MAPTGNNLTPAQAEQLRLAKELQQQFQKSGTFHGTSSKGRATARPEPPRRQTSRSQSSRPQDPYNPNSQPSTSSRPPTSSRSSTSSRPQTSSRPSASHTTGLLPPTSSTRPSNQQLRQQPDAQPHSRNQDTATSKAKPTPSGGNRKRKMAAQTADFFADRPNTAQERGPVHYYQGQDRAVATGAPSMNATATMAQTPATLNAAGNAPDFTLLDIANPEQQSIPNSELIRSSMNWNTGAASFSPGMASVNNGMAPGNTDMASNNGMGRPSNGMGPGNNDTTPTNVNMFPGGSGMPFFSTATGPTNTDMDSANTGTGMVSGVAPARKPVGPTHIPVNPSVKIEIPQGPVIWHYQDNNELPQPLPSDENMMDMDMPDAASTACTCTHKSPPGTRGLGASRWATTSRATGERILDVNCPQHGGTLSQNGNGAAGNQRHVENGHKAPMVWYYQ